MVRHPEVVARVRDPSDGGDVVVGARACVEAKAEVHIRGHPRDEERGSLVSLKLQCREPHERVVYNKDIWTFTRGIGISIEEAETVG